jgi:hypothetical protein
MDNMAIVRSEPRILSGSTHADREARAQRLADNFVKFISEAVPLLIQVRQDFLDKDRDRVIHNCRTFTEYCTSVLRYSESHIRRLIAGHNPATKKFDGSKNRQLVLLEGDQRTLESDPLLCGLDEAQTGSALEAAIEQLTPDHVLRGKFGEDWLIVEPADHEGEWYFVTMMETDIRGNASLLGSNKPIAKCGVALYIKYMLPSKHMNMAWDVFACPADFEKRNYNRWLYDSHQEYFELAVLGKEQISAMVGASS